MDEPLPRPGRSWRDAASGRSDLARSRICSRWIRGGAMTRGTPRGLAGRGAPSGSLECGGRYRGISMSPGGDIPVRSPDGPGQNEKPRPCVQSHGGATLTYIESPS